MTHADGLQACKQEAWIPGDPSSGGLKAEVEEFLESCTDAPKHGYSAQK
jgi:hypothetical protein